MGYYIDLEKITLSDYCKKLHLAYLPPGRMILKEKTEERFGYFEKTGIKNIKELILFLKKKDSFAQISEVEGFSADYLTILLRELNSIHPKPNKLADFKEISKDAISRLAQAGIKDTEKLYYKVITKKQRNQLAESLGLNEQDVLQLTCLTDLSRIKWVGATYALLLHDLGVDSVEKVSASDAPDLHARINQRIKELTIFKGGIGINDVKILIETANELPVEIEY